MEETKKINEQYIDDILNVIYNNEKMLSDILITLIKKDKAYITSDIISQIKWIPQEVTAHIFKTLNKDAFTLLSSFIKTSLYDTWESNEAVVMSIGSKLHNILDSKKIHSLSLEDYSTYTTMRDFLSCNYTEAKCKCGNDLLDPDGEGICTNVILPFVFNKKDQCYEEVIEEYEEISGRYQCGNCGRDITELIEHLI